MARDLVVESRFTLDDRFSSRFSAMMAKAESSLTSAKTKFGRFNRNLLANEENFKKVGRSAGVFGGVVLGGLGLAAASAVKFEDSMADVAKVMNVKVGSDALSRVGADVKQLSEHLGVMPKNVAKLYASLAQGGVEIGNVSKIAKIAGEAGVAFDISAGEAGEAFVKIRNAMGKTNKEAEVTFNAINALSNKYSSSASDLITFMKKGGASAAGALKITGRAVSAFGSVLVSAGKSPEEAATAFKVFMRKVYSDKSLHKTFVDAGRGLKGVMAIFKKGHDLTGDKRIEFFSQFDRQGSRLRLISANFGQLKESLNLVSDASKVAGSVTGEFANKQSTTGASLRRLRSSAMSLAISLGNAVLPIIEELVKVIKPVVKSFTNWASENKDTLKSIVKIAAVVGGLSLALSGISYMFVGYIKIIKLAKLAQSAFNVVMAANPIGLVTLAVAALGAGLIYLSSKYDGLTSKQRAYNNVTKKAMENTLDQRVEAHFLFKQLKKLNPETDKYKAVLKKIEDIQPGITKQYDLQKGKINDINAAYKDLNKTLILNAKIAAAKDLMKASFKSSLESKMKSTAAGKGDVSFLDRFKAAFSSFGGFYTSVIKGNDYKAVQDYYNRRLVESVSMAKNYSSLASSLSTKRDARLNSVKEPSQVSEFPSMMKSQIDLFLHQDGTVQKFPITQGKNNVSINPQLIPTL